MNGAELASRGAGTDRTVDDRQKFMTIGQRLVRRWRVFWLWRAGPGFRGRMASRMAGFGLGRYRGQTTLAWMTPKGYIAPDAEIDVDLRRGSNVLVGERAVILRSGGNGFVDLRDGVQINRDCSLEIFRGRINHDWGADGHTTGLCAGFRGAADRDRQKGADRLTTARSFPTITESRPIRKFTRSRFLRKAPSISARMRGLEPV